MKLGIPTETFPGELRVALTPSVIPALIKEKVEILVEVDAGINAGFSNTDYESQGAQIESSQADLYAKSDIIACVRGPSLRSEDTRNLGLLRHNQTIIGLLDPLTNPETALEFSAKGVTSFALELLPRISRAQPMDVLSSMATVSGYKAALLAANYLPKFYPLLMTAAGTIIPAKVLVLGAGVAGLQAIATSRRLGALVQAYDVRSEVKNQVESLGAKFLELELDTVGTQTSGGYAQAMDEGFYQRQQVMMRAAIADSDVVITTAAIQGKRAPILVTADMTAAMKPGSIIIDMAAESGGNCELTKPGESVKANGIVILGPLNLPSSIAYHSSQMYAKNLTNFLLNLTVDGEINIDYTDPIIRDSIVTYKDTVVNPKICELLQISPPTEPTNI